MAITAVHFSIFFHFIFIGNGIDPESVYGRQTLVFFNLICQDIREDNREEENTKVKLLRLSSTLTNSIKQKF